MPHDFGSSRDRRSASLPGAGIGFHELRQACEISALREDVERLAHEAGVLRDGVEHAVEIVRDRFAALSAEEMADPMVLAPLLQLAVTTLLDIREQARQLNTQTGPLSDDERPSWLGAADAPRLRHPAAAAWDDHTDAGSGGGDMDEEIDPAPAPLNTVPPRPAEPPIRAVRPALAAPLPPEPRSPVPVAEPFLTAPAEARPSATPEARVSEGHASWLAGEPAPAPPPSRAATVRASGGGQRTSGGIDWLGPAGR
ncbi:hypothetical protein HUE56_17105 [Azospirillum oryzae]|uniref:Uncharacterized protein n=1 Tax=Azospirillum oryzae TaxID=286727 RepID=A0A6N1AP02_9PROT|nr:hypothetical protein [Azospirillum oryzae]KAA0590850.1 hypothetical protein FZ938_01695 [Azospirillum oryzae]QKS52137.1 hypothetical protein HUE56_17105 [Azospirillum oryzae]GLR82076.1 hypothetical protein GCM10007856_47680 [Azospirillum oryzae]